MKPRDLWIRIQMHIGTNKRIETFLLTLLQILWTLADSRFYYGCMIRSIVSYLIRLNPIFEVVIWSIHQKESSTSISYAPVGAMLELNQCCTLFSSASMVANSEETNLPVFMLFHLVSWCLKSVSSIIAVRKFLHKACVILLVFYMDKSLWLCLLHASDVSAFAWSHLTFLTMRGLKSSAWWLLRIALLNQKNSFKFSQTICFSAWEILEVSYS